MKKTISLFIIIVLVCALSFTLSACENGDEDVKIDYFEIEDMELTEGDKFTTTSESDEEALVTCYKTDGTSVKVVNNLYFDTSEIDDLLDEDNKLIEGSAGEYTIPVYHLDMHIGDMALTVNVSR